MEALAASRKQKIIIGYKYNRNLKRDNIMDSIQFNGSLTKKVSVPCNCNRFSVFRKVVIFHDFMKTAR